jgi:hypothetical protein
MISVQPEWCLNLPLQQQSVLLLAARGPDQIRKTHPCKPIVVAYRGTVLLAAKYGRLLYWGEKADGFMSLDTFANAEAWGVAVSAFFHWIDDLPHHYLMHLMHGVQIVGYKHPDDRFRLRWNDLYLCMVESMHLNVETEQEMDHRLNDWQRLAWDKTP